MTRSDCPCVVAVGELEDGGKPRRFFYMFPDLELNDANEWRKYKAFIKSCWCGECGCERDNVADCVAHCNEWSVAVEFKSALGGLGVINEKKEECEHLFKEACLQTNGKAVVFVGVQTPIKICGVQPVIANVCNLKSVICSNKRDKLFVILNVWSPHSCT